MRGLAGVRREKLTLANGIPVTIALDDARGRRVPSRIPGAPDQIYYQLAGGREMYVPLEVGIRIDEMRLREGESFMLCKYGPQNWDIERAHQQKSEAPGLTSQAASHQSLSNELPTSVAPRMMNGAGETTAQLLAACYPDAIAIALRAVAQAKDAGLLIAPSFEDVRAIATTLFIQERAK